MDTKTYAKHIKDNLDIVTYSSMVTSLGNSLNSRKDRFDKSEIIEKSFELYSNGKFKHVDDIGRDHRDEENNIDLEFKFSENGLFTKVKKLPKKYVTVKLKNSLGKNKGITIDNPANFYVIGQQDSIAIISYADIEPYLIDEDDGISAKIPLDKLTFVFKPNEVSDKIKINEKLSYKQFKAEAILNYIKGFCEH